MPPRRDVIAATARLVSLARAGLLASARELFDEMPERDTVAWNAMLAAYSRCGRPLQALSLFSRMRTCGICPDPFSLTTALAVAADLRDIHHGRKLHGLINCLGLMSSLPVCNALIDMYGKCFCPLEASRVFEGMEEHNEVSWCSLLYGYVNSGLLKEAQGFFLSMPDKKTIAWNIIIKGYAHSCQTEFCIELFKEMLSLGLKGDAVTFTALMTTCSELSDSSLGCMIHAFILQRGWPAAVEVSNAVISFYAKFGFRDDALKVFESMETRTQVSWNAMIDANIKYGYVKGAILLFRNAPETNIISWTSMIAGLSRNGYGEEALSFYVDMMRKSLKPDDFTLGAVLHACALLTALANGKMLHSCVIRSGFHSSLYVANGLVNMYAKCGDIQGANLVFLGIKKKDLVSWNAMLFGYALHGWAMKALQVYKNMLACNVIPDKVTFMGLLMACSHSGLVEQGKAFFHIMESSHGVKPDADHVACIVDMIGRAGQLREADEWLHNSSGIAGEALVSACIVQGDSDVIENLGKKLVSMEPHNEVGYVMLSNSFCGKGQWREAEKVRRAMIEQGIKKSPGCSWIQVRDTVMVFVSGDQSLTNMLDVHDLVELLHFQMRNPTFIFSEMNIDEYFPC